MNEKNMSIHLSPEDAREMIRFNRLEFQDWCFMTNFRLQSNI